MEKVKFMLDEKESVEFFLLEQTKLSGNQYLLVSDVEEGDGNALILKEIATGEEKKENVYEVVEDDMELGAVAAVFESLLEDIEFS